MKWVTVVLLVALAVFQYDLWFARGGWHDRWRLEDEYRAQQNTNAELTRRNQQLQAEINDLKNGQDAMAEIARDQLGYVQNGEVFYRIVVQKDGRSNAAPAAAPTVATASAAGKTAIQAP